MEGQTEDVEWPDSPVFQADPDHLRREPFAVMHPGLGWIITKHAAAFQMRAFAKTIHEATYRLTIIFSSLKDQFQHMFAKGSEELTSQ